MTPNLRAVVAQVYRGGRSIGSRNFSSSAPGSRNGNVLWLRTKIDQILGSWGFDMYFVSGFVIVIPISESMGAGGRVVAPGGLEHFVETTSKMSGAGLLPCTLFGYACYIALGNSCWDYSYIIMLRLFTIYKLVIFVCFQMWWRQEKKPNSGYSVGMNWYELFIYFFLCVQKQKQN